MASKDAKLRLARAIVLGEKQADIARELGCTPRTIRNLVKQPDVVKMIGAEREALERRVEQYRARLVGLGKKALANLEEVVHDTRHPKRFEASRFVVERLLPSRSSVKVESDPMDVFASPGVREELTDALKSVAAIYQQLDAEGVELNKPDRHIKIGREALPPAGGALPRVVLVDDEEEPAQH